mgnify:CR=1 FL=1
MKVVGKDDIETYEKKYWLDSLYSPKNIFILNPFLSNLNHLHVSIDHKRDLRWKDSNLWMMGALPLGHAPWMINTMTIPYFDSCINLSFSLVGCLCGEGRDGKKTFSNFCGFDNWKTQRKEEFSSLLFGKKKKLFLLTNFNGRHRSIVKILL